MNILYGLSGEGYGHSSRALLIIPFSQKLGHKVKVLTHDKGSEVLSSKFDVFQIHGTRLMFKSGRVRKRRTVLYNLINFPKNYFERKRINKMIKEFKPDLCITDYEPLTYIISKLYRLPLISIGNHQIMDYAKIKIPAKYYADYVLTKSINKSFTPDADYFIITSFLKMQNKKKVFFVSPLVRDEIKKTKPGKKGRVVVYLNNADYIVPILRQVNEKFIVYGFNKNEKQGNIEFKTKDPFLRDLKDCKAVIATAGFTLISEALYLKKPYFAIPQKGQFEQVFNALTLQQQGFGDFSDHISREDIESFLSGLDKYSKNLKKYNPDWNEIYDVLKRVLDKFKR